MALKNNCVLLPSLASLLFSEGPCKYAKDNKIDIREVGKGKYLYNDAITLTTFYDYLQLPKLHHSKDCLINYMAGCRTNPTAANPLMFIYQE